MTKATLNVDGRETGQALVEAGRVLAPVAVLCDALGAEYKRLDGLDHPAVCRGDLCIPLDAVTEDTRDVDGLVHVWVDSISDPLGLSVTVDEREVTVMTTQPKEGLGAGDRPPAFTLPDLFTGETVSTSDYAGRKTVYYMWASW